MIDIAHQVLLVCVPGWRLGRGRQGLREVDLVAHMVELLQVVDR